LEPNGEGKEREVERRQRVGEQARVRVACEIIGQYLSPDVFQALVTSYEYVSYPSMQLSLMTFA
jgi:hypothetical protein